MKNFTSLIILLLAVVLVYFYIYPNVATVKAIYAKKQTYTQALEVSNQVAEIRDELIAKFQAISPVDKDHVNKILPDSFDQNRFYLTLNNIATHNDVNIQGIGNSENKKSSNRSKDDKNTTTSFQSIDSTITVQASYDDMIAFIKDIESSLQLTDVVGLNFQTSTGGEITYTITLRNYWFPLTNK